MFNLFTSEDKKLLSLFIVICVVQNILHPYTAPKLIQTVPAANIVVEFSDDTTFEYGSYVDPSSLIVSLENCTIRKYPEIDTTILGEQTVTFELVDKYGTIERKSLNINIIE